MSQQDSLQFCPNCGFNIANYKASKKNTGNDNQKSQSASVPAAPKSGNRFNQPN